MNTSPALRDSPPPCGHRLPPARRPVVIAFGALVALSLWTGATGAAQAPAPAEVDGPPLPAFELSRTVTGSHAEVVVAIDWAALGTDPLRVLQPCVADRACGDWNERTLEQMVRHWLALLEHRGVRSLVLRTASPVALPRLGLDAGELVALNALLPELAPVPRRPWEPAPGAGGPIEAAPRPGPPSTTLSGQSYTGVAAGALQGKTIYVSQGHGWYWSDTLGRWATQRGNTHDIVEDFVNAEAANLYLVPMLRNAGATVVTVREHDMQPLMAIVDDGGGKPAGGKGGYFETGTWQKGTNAGFGSGNAPYKGAANPFALGGYRATAVVNGSATASATFVPTIAETGTYAVYVGYTAGTNRAADAHFEIRHAGGVSHRRVDMRRHGQTWTFLGDFRFSAGTDASQGAVVLHNDSAQPAQGKYVIADVVRFGGGEGLIVRGQGKPPTKGPTSGRPRWEECARYSAQYSGAPTSVWDPSSSDNADDVTTRSRFAAWHREEGEDALYFSWHTNAPSPARGTSTYVYGPNSPDGSYKFTGTKGSDAFAKLIQKITVADIRAAYDPKWKDRGVYSAWFGELNPNNNPEMPAALVEAAFHSTKEDADFLREPRFRHLLARGFYKAIVRYFAERDGKPVLLLPEPPTSLRIQVLGPKVARVSWLPGSSGGIHGDKATGYLLQRSSDGRAFDDGQPVAGTTADIDLEGPGVPVFVRVLALNAGGISLPSAVLGAASGCNAGATALFVQGFTRMSASLMPIEDLSAFALAKVQRLRPWRMNTFDHAAEHIVALAAAGVSVDAVQREALTALPGAGAGSLSAYALIDWAAGEQSTEDGVFSADERKALSAWLQGGAGRALLASGSEIAWAVDHKGGPAEGDWLATWFGARFQDDDAGVYGFQAAAGSGLSLGGGAFDDGTHHSYDVDYPDTLKLQGAKALLEYADGKGVAASLWQVGGAVTALVGFPLETVYPAGARAALMAALVDRLAVGQETWPCPVATADTDGPDAGGQESDGPDAGSQDAGPADGGPETIDDVGPPRDPDTGGGAPADAGPAAPQDASAADAGSLDAAGLDARPPALSSLAPASDDGCGCHLGPGSRGPGSGVWAMLALLAALWGLARRRRAAP